MSKDTMLYGTSELIGVITQIAPETMVWSNFFGMTRLSEKETVYFERQPNYRQIAPFCSPYIGGKLTRLAGRTLHEFRPAYIKIAHQITIEDAMARSPGEEFGGEMTNEMRYNAAIVEALMIQGMAIERRIEWLATRAIADAKVTIEGPAYPKQEIDFGRDAALTSTLTGDARWSQTTSKPLDNIKAMRDLIADKAGVTATRIMMGRKAAEAFMAHKQVTDAVAAQALRIERLSGDSFITRFASPGSSVPMELIGHFTGPRGQGTYDVYSYYGRYEDASATARPYLNEWDVVFLAEEFIEGVKLFGAIRDPHSMLRPMQIFSRMWTDIGDPAGTYAMSQSAPLCAPLRPDATAKITVGSD